MSNINPNPFTTRPEIDGTFGVVTSTHWIATAVGMAMLERGGNAFDAARRHRLHAAGGRAASQRARRRRAGDPVRRAQGQARGDLRPGAGAGRRHHRALPQPRPRHGARHRPARRLRARHVRHLDAAAARLRHDAAAPTCWRPRSTTPRTAIRWSSAPAPPSRRSRNCSASTGRPRRRSICRTARCRSRARCSPTRRWPRPTRASCSEAESAGGDRDAQIETARKVWCAGLRRRGDRPVLPHAGGHGHQRRRAIAAC